MKVISEFNNEQGIEILMECADDIQAIILDSEISQTLEDKGSFLKIGAIAYKKHKTEVMNVFKALGEQPKTAVEITVGITQVLVDILSDQSFKDFFTFLQSRSGMISQVSATENTEAEA